MSTFRALKKVTSQVAAPGAESAVCDCLVVVGVVRVRQRDVGGPKWQHWGQSLRSVTALLSLVLSECVSAMWVVPSGSTGGRVCGL